jgi:putative NADH-flavin reductase
MKIAIFGASGKTGILTVYQALDKGHQVTAFARNPSSVTIQHKKLTIVQGDILDYENVKKAVEGQEVVICALGVESRKHSTVLSEGTRNIVRAMEECKVNRIICMSSAGVLVNDAGILYGKIIIPIFLKQVFLDKIRQLNIIRETNLDWVIIRPTSLTDAPKTGKYKITKGPPATGKIPRADVADFMLKLITNKQYDRQMPAISS